MATQKGEVAPRASLSVIDGIAIMIGIVVGIGIFRFPSLVASNVPDETMFIAIWLIGGAITLVGALVYAELAATYPSTGGEYYFLRRALGQPVGFMFAWARISVIQTGAIAIVAFVFGDYAQQVFALGPHGAAIYAAVAIIALTAVNLVGTFEGKNTQLIFTGLTLAAVMVVIVAGLMAPAAELPAAPAASGSGGAIGLALLFVLFTYGGWNETAYLSAEVRNVRRDMIRILVLGIAAITAIYLVINLAYLHALGIEGIRGSDAVAADLMRIVMGEAGAITLSIVICIAAISTLNGTIFTGARVYHALGEDLVALRGIGAWSGAGNNPRNALLLQGVIALALVAFGAFTRSGIQTLVDYTFPVFWFFLLLVGVSFFVLRYREPHRERPFRTPLYPVTPLIFIATCAYLLYSTAMYSGLGALVGFGAMLLGLPLLLLVRDRRSLPAE